MPINNWTGTRVFTQEISGDECIGNSLTKINQGFLNLDCALDDLSGHNATNVTNIATVSSTIVTLSSTSVTQITASTTKIVAPSGDFTTIQAAFDWLSNYRINSTATVTIYVSAGTWNIPSTINVNHLDLDRVVLRGDDVYTDNGGVVSVSFSTSLSGGKTMNIKMANALPAWIAVGGLVSVNYTNNTLLSASSALATEAVRYLGCFEITQLVDTFTVQLRNFDQLTTQLQTGTFNSTTILNTSPGSGGFTLSCNFFKTVIAANTSALPNNSALKIAGRGSLSVYRLGLLNSWSGNSTNHLQATTPGTTAAGTVTPVAGISVTYGAGVKLWDHVGITGFTRGIEVLQGSYANADLKIATTIKNPNLVSWNTDAGNLVISNCNYGVYVTDAAEFFADQRNVNAVVVTGCDYGVWVEKNATLTSGGLQVAGCKSASVYTRLQGNAHIGTVFNAGETPSTCRIFTTNIYGTYTGVTFRADLMSSIYINPYPTQIGVIHVETSISPTTINTVGNNNAIVLRGV